MEPTSEVARSELGAELGRAGAPRHPEDGLGGRGVHGPQLAVLLPPHAGVGTTSQSGLLLRVEETAGPRWLAATGTAVWPAAATAAEEEEEVSTRGSLAFPPPGLGERWGKQRRGRGTAAGISLVGPPGSQEQE